ncbi:MAG: hypothetical protein NVSMB42_17330 [Herpetosiphon sp.]
MIEPGDLDVSIMLARLVLAGIIGAFIGYERRRQHKAIGISGMLLIAVGSTTFMLLAKHEANHDSAAVSRTIQGLLQGIGFLAGAVIFKGGTDVRGIKTATAIWITGAVGLAIGTGFWWLGVIVGVTTAITLFVTDLLSPPQRQSETENTKQTE